MLSKKAPICKSNSKCKQISTFWLKCVIYIKTIHFGCSWIYTSQTQFVCLTETNAVLKRKTIIWCDPCHVSAIVVVFGHTLSICYSKFLRFLTFVFGPTYLSIYWCGQESSIAFTLGGTIIISFNITTMLNYVIFNIWRFKFTWFLMRLVKQVSDTDHNLIPSHQNLVLEIRLRFHVIIVYI